MEQLLEVIQQTYNLVNEDSVVEKSSLFNYMTSIDSLLCEALDDISLDYSNLSYLSNIDEKERLNLLEEKLRNIKTSPQVALCELVSFGQDRLRAFLDKYNIGFIKNITLDDSGMFICDIGCVISSHDAFGDKKASAAKKLEQQMKFLQSIGFDMGESKIGNGTPVLLGTQQNIDLIIHIIEDLGGIGISCSMRHYKNQITIRDLSFRIKWDKLLEYDGKIKEKSSCITSKLNKDERLFLRKELKELYSTYNSFQDKDLAKVSYACKNIILHSFANICNTIGIETKISKSVNDYFRDSREINAKIIRKTEEVREELSNVTNIREIVSSVRRNIEKIAYEKLGFVVSNFEIGYSLNVSLRFNTLGECYEDDIEEMSEDKLKETFETTGGEFDNETLFVLNTENNIEKLSSILKSFIPSVEICNINTEFNWRTGAYIIQTITVTIQDLSTL